MQEAVNRPVSGAVKVARWPSEIPLFIVATAVSLIIWAALVVGSFGLGLIYVAAIVLFVFFAQVGFIAHLRGSAIRLGPDQFPDLHARVVELSRRAGLKAPPEAYILQADGALNALATKFFRGEMIVLYSDLLAACGDDEAARDMIIGHEIGHLRSGHLNWFIVNMPARLIPFLGAAYSRACEYTCDRWGAALSGDGDGARRGLTILAAGGVLSRQVNLEAFVRQQQHLDTGWMTIGRWLSGYPPLSARIAAIEPAAPRFVPSRGRLRAVGILLAFLLVPVLATLGFAFTAPYIGDPFGLAALEEQFEPSSGDETADPAPDASYASVDEMPPPDDVPVIEDTALAALAASCHDGDLQACDDLFYQSPGGSTEEAYGNTCAGRLPDNTIECAVYINE